MQSLLMMLVGALVVRLLKNISSGRLFAFSYMREENSDIVMTRTHGYSKPSLERGGAKGFATHTIACSGSQVSKSWL